MNLFIDIETIPAQDTTVRAEIDAKHAVADSIDEIKAAANLTAPDKIAADIEKRTAKAVADLAERKVAGLAAAEEEWRRTALDASKGHVLSIAWATGDGPVDCRILTGPDTAHPADEAYLLRAFFSAVDPLYDLDGGDPQLLADRLRGGDSAADLTAMLSPPRIVAHHADFDIRFLWQRAVVIGVRVPTWWPINVPTWKQDRVFCMMAAWAGAGGRIELDRLCKALGLPGKEGFDGGMIWDAVKEGRIAEVIEYNCGDIVRLRSCFRRLNGLPAVVEIAA